jgi:hypothetical protein
MIARLTGLLAATAAIAILAVGCGSGSNSDRSGSTGTGAEGKAIKTSSLSKDQFIKQASALCGQERKGILAETEAYLTEQSAQGVSRPVLFADAAKAVLMPAVEIRIAGIRKLGAPAGDEGEVEEMLAGQEAGIEQVMKLKTFYEGESLLPYFTESNKKFNDYGLAACAYNL